jgi:hypothetical protein
MGIGPGSRISESVLDVARSVVINNNPNPYNFKITKELVIEEFVIVMVNYPDCTNYEGNKILVYENMTLSDIKRLSILDPHFSKDKPFQSPIARFVPNDQGWIYAITMVKAILG